ncbi:MAG: caspase family protein [Saprospiraceae bacterium]|nr:caspase family protein [Saprospiraceae bacterium]
MTNKHFENGYALIIGVQEDILAVSDANKLYEILTNPQKAGYPTAQVQVITEGGATKQGILTALTKLKNQVATNPQATVLIYYSGHGGQFTENDATNYYLIPNDFDDNNTQTGISKQEFSGCINEINAQKMMLIFDCCHADGIKAIGHINSY